MKPGEHLVLLAEQAGLLAMSVWNLPENQKLRKLRRNPCVLGAGDVVFIPDRRPKTVTAATGSSRSFVIKRDTLRLRFGLFDFDNRPMSGVRAQLEVEGTPLELTTDGKGEIEREIAATAKTGRLKIPSLDIDLAIAIGRLEPAAVDAGWRARLVNLGYYRGEVDDAGAAATKFWAWALEEFQCDHGLKVTGKPDAATVAKLEAVHGS